MTVPDLTNPHDRFFKEVMSREEVARDFLTNYLPEEVVALFDLTSLEVVKDSFVDPELQESFSDLLYRTSLKEGSDACVYVLFEHKSFPEPLVAFHLLRYMVRIWEQALKQHTPLAPILPVVIYHGKAKWKIGLNLRDLIPIPAELEAYLPDYRYWLCDLSRYDDPEVKGEVMLQVAWRVLKHIFDDDLPERLLEIAGLLAELSRQTTGLQYVETVLRYLVGATDKVTSGDLNEVVRTALGERGELVMPTIAEQWIEQGKREGLLTGIELGLELRFGHEGLRLLPEVYKIQDVDVLKAISEGIKKVTTIEELRSLYWKGSKLSG